MASAGVLWSTLGLGVRLMDTADPWQIMFYRAPAQVVVVSALVAARRGRAFADAFRHMGANGLAASVCLAGASWCMVYALTLATVAEVILVFSSAPVMAGLLGWLFLRETVGRRTWWTMGLATIGLFVMTSAGLGGGDVLGTALAFGSAFGFASFTVLQRRGRNTDMVPAVAVAGILTIVVAGSLMEGAAMAGRDVAIATYLGGVGLAGGLVLYTAGARYVRSAEMVLISMTEVVLAPLWVWWVFGETASSATLAGGALVLTSVAIQARAGGR